MPVAQAAEGVVRIIDVKMEEAIKAISTMRGHDLRDFMLLAFGGAGPLHAGRIARDLGIAGVIVPLHPGVFSAIGLLMSDVEARLRPIPNDRRSSELTVDAVEAMFAGSSARRWRTCGRTVFPPPRIGLDRALDMRYAGQGYEIAVPATKRAARRRPRRAAPHFDDLHRRCSVTWRRTEPVEVVSYRLRGIGRGRRRHCRNSSRPAASCPMRCASTGRCGSTAKASPARFISASGSTSGWRCEGPAILDQFDCTTVICRARPRGSTRGRT